MQQIFNYFYIVITLNRIRIQGAWQVCRRRDRNFKELAWEKGVFWHMGSGRWT